VCCYQNVVTVFDLSNIVVMHCIKMLTHVRAEHGQVKDLHRLKKLFSLA